MKLTDIAAPDYFHKVVDCQWACPAHTPVPEYIRLIAAGRYGDAYMINWKSNVFPGILGRTCDRPCEPACRRGRVEKEPVAICRLKRVAADYKEDITARLPKAGGEGQAQRQAHRAGRRRPRLAHRRARSRADGLRMRRVRRRLPLRRHDALADPEIPPARQGDRRGVQLHPRSRRRVPRRPSDRQPEDAARRRLGRGVRRLRRAARARTRYSGPQGSQEEHPHRHRLALLGLVRPRHQDRQARDRARRRQHRDGLLPLLAPPRRRGRQGDRALRLRGDEGVALGKGRRDARGHPDPQFPRAEGIHPPGRQAHRRHVREGEGRVRRQGPPQAGAVRRAGPAFRMRRRAGRGRPGELVPLDRARHRARIRQVGHAEGRSEDLRVDQSEGVLRRRCGVRPEEHHLGGGARPRGRGLDRQVPQRRGHQRSPAARGRSRQPEDGHPRVVATTTTSRTTSATACRRATTSSR